VFERPAPPPPAPPAPRRPGGELRPVIKTYFDLAKSDYQPGESPTIVITAEWPIEDGAILITSAGVLLALDEVAYTTWRLQREGLARAEVVRRIAEEWQVSAEQVEVGCAWILDEFRASDAGSRVAL
jgi:hypothetical protein